MEETRKQEQTRVAAQQSDSALTVTASKTDNHLTSRTDSGYHSERGRGRGRTRGRGRGRNTSSRGRGMAANYNHQNTSGGYYQWHWGFRVMDFDSGWLGQAMVPFVFSLKLASISFQWLVNGAKWLGC
ncbi:hypothetical protein E3N88_02596 [Mikania micrantha]|uniref:Uncharacterized protein n=1 Tax=Mikania micrantha TaxID=192012 RepID=A0A5N6Q6X7_9ASTR|nr:hypothetical protein E3N88_02596 [Mikania micrantha]